MATITIRKGDADTLTETVTGLSSLSGYSAKLYIVDADGEELDTLTGTISGLTITYQIVNENSKAYSTGKYWFETKIWDSSDHVYTLCSGRFIVRVAIENDPS